MNAALGLDVALRRGCDAVTVDDDLIALPVGRVRRGAELTELLDVLEPSAIAIDAPPRWAPPTSARQCERELSKRGISLFTTPDGARGTASTFYAWMEVGFEMFRAARRFPTLETFPHAIAVVIHGHLPATGLLRNPRVKRAWRLAALQAVGVDVTALATVDQIDAALCAYTARAWTRGGTVSLGDPAEGQITLPGAALHDRYRTLA